MRKLKLFLSLLMVMLLSVGNVWATDYQLINSTDDLEANANYVIGNAASGTAKFMATTENSDNRKPTDAISITDGKITATNAVLVLKLEGSTGAWKFKTTNYAGTDGYLYNANSGTGNKCFVGSTEREFTISFSGDAAVITATGGNNRNILRWNTSGLFACYGSGQSPVYLFKEVESAAELVSITVTGDLTKKSYEAGDALDFSGLTATGNYDDDSHADLTSSVEWSFSPALTAGLTSVTVTATLNEISGNKVISGLTVAEHVVTPGTYCIPMTNALWGTSYSGTASAETEVSGSSHDVSVTLTKGGSTNMYINDTETRAYGSYSLVIGVPAGYVITAMTFTKGSNWNCSTTTGTLNGQSWTGTANSEAFSFSGRTDFKAVSVTYELDVKYAINFSTPSNGTLVINDGEENITSGDEYHEGDELTITATPNDGFKLDGIKVIETGSDPENDVTSTVLDGTTLTVPAYAITVSAAFSANEAPFATLTLSEIGEETVYYNNNTKREGDVVSLPLDAASCSKVFRGWDPNVDCATEPTYAPGADFTLGASASNKLYAVYATPIVDTESEPALAQTLLYDTWTYSGTTTNKSSYRLFGNGSYVESAEFDLSMLAKVKVFGGTYGGQDTYKTGTIGDGTNTWKSIELTGTGNAKEHEFIEGNALSGNGKLYVTSTCGNGTDNGLRISKVEIYTYGTTYGEYSTECLAKVDAPTFPVAQQEYTEATNITISAVAGATIHYTTDGSIPTSTSATYTAPIALSARGEYVIKAIAVKDGFANSDVAVAHYSINLPFANLSDLVEANLADGSEVIVSFEDEVITNKGSKYIYLTTLDANDNPVEIYYGSANIPEGWVVGGKVSATAKRFTWTLFGESQWELVPVGEFAWATDLAYTAPKTVSSVVVTGAPTKTVYKIGETFDPAGLTVTINYSDETSEVNPAVGVTFTTDPANGKMALEQTSIKVKATYNNVTSEEWFTVNGLTVNDLETKTIAEFIAAQGGRCYLVGTVSNITNTQYGNFDLTDASGTIYVYGCLDTEGASKNFASLDVVEDDYIKVIADVYEYYNNETHEAKNVQFVEELEKPEIPVASVSVADATVKVNKTVQLTETVLPINASNKSVTWSVKAGSEAIAEVNETTGVVTGLSEGEAVIIATSVADNTKFGECTVTVTGGINFAAGDFVLVEDAAELTEGTYVIVADAGTTYNVAMKYLEGTDKIHNPKAAVKDGKFLHYDSEFGVYQIKNYVVEEVLQGISFLNEDAENYLALPSASNELRVSETQDANSAWTVSISDGVATIANKALTARKIRYNSGSPRFACYESGQRDIALYKYVTPAAYRVYYNDNVAEEEIEVPVYQSVDGENKVTISAVEPVRDGYLFGGWKDGEANVYEAGVEYTLSGDITLYAQWKTAVVSTLSYNPNGGTLIGGETAIADAEVAEGANLTIAANVYEKGDNYVFAGWKFGDDVYQPGDPFEMPANDVEFVAQWNEIEISDYTLVTDLAQLQAGDKIIIVAADYNVAAGSQAATYRNPVTIGKTASKNNLILAGYTTPTEFTLGISDGKFSFNDGAGYMYENGEKSVKVQDDPYYWTISIDAEAIATITGTNPLLYNSNNNQERFTTYTSEQKVLQLYRKPGDAPVYTTVRTDLNEGEYYTMCLKNKVTAVQGGTIWRVLSKADNGTDVILEEVTGTLDAGRPYIFRATADKLEVAYTGVVANAPITTGNNGLIGSFIQTKITQSDDNYIIYNNALYYVNSNNVYVGAHRAYLDMTGVPAYSNEPQQGAPRRRVVMAVNGQNGATGFENINATEKPMKLMIDGKIYILRGEKMYDVKGQLVK